ncbi:MAG: hypothetical protein KAI66_19525 [Lentisphaeria bacterium]|nr:hypothetical protein [Lentisphaeria bacterium]
MLEALLSSLNRPYCYDIRAIYYDWADTIWKPLPQPLPPEDSFHKWLGQLVENEDIEMLENIRLFVEEATPQPDMCVAPRGTHGYHFVSEPIERVDRGSTVQLCFLPLPRHSNDECRN